MKIFVTGITGFVGGTVANYFSAKGYTVIGIGRKLALPPHVLKDCDYTPADITRPLDTIDADIVIHAAAIASDTTTFKNANAVNVTGTENVLQAAKKARHFIYISSSSVYNFGTNAMYEVEAGKDYLKLSAYGQTKWLAEEAVKKHTGIFKKSILRPRAIYGKQDQVLLPRLLKLVKGNKLIVPAHLSKNISLTHVNNLVSAIELCIEKQQTEEAVFNVADKEIYDLRYVLTTLLPAIIGKPLKCLTIPATIFELLITINENLKFNSALNRFAASSLTNVAILDTSAITRKLGYNPTRNFENSYSEIVHWVHNEEGWKNFFNNKPANLNMNA